MLWFDTKLWRVCQVCQRLKYGHCFYSGKVRKSYEEGSWHVTSESASTKSPSTLVTNVTHFSMFMSCHKCTIRQNKCAFSQGHHCVICPHDKTVLTCVFITRICYGHEVRWNVTNMHLPLRDNCVSSETTRNYCRFDFRFCRGRKNITYMHSHKRDDLYI